MIIQVLQENLLKGLIRTGRTVSSRPQLPILQNVLLVAENGQLRISTTNLETTESVFIGAKIEEDGTACVSSRTFSEFVSSLPQETVKISVKEGGLHVLCLGFSAVLPTSASGDFPPVPVLSEKGAAIGKEDFIQAIRSVLFAAATDEGRPLLTGIKVIKKKKETLFVATDGYRLSVKTMPMDIGVESDVVVPASALGEVVKIAQEEKGEKKIILALTKDNQMGFIVRDTQVITRLIDGEYPNFEKIIPTSHTTHVRADTAEFIRAVRSAAVFARDNANIVRLAVSKEGITVSANTPQVGENIVKIEAETDGEGGEIAFNCRFLTEFFSNFLEEEFIFEMTGSLNPGVFRPVKDKSFFYIVMPVRVQR